jgi:hypothetical protein
MCTNCRSHLGEKIPWLLLGLCAQPREDTGLSPAEAGFGALIVLPNEFLKGDEIPVNTISKNFLKSLKAHAFSLPRYNLSRQLPSEMATLAATRPGGPAASKRVSFSDLLVSSPSLQEQPRIRPETIFLLSRIRKPFIVCYTQWWASYF